MSTINKNSLSKNRGVELILRKEKPIRKTFQYGFEKIIVFFSSKLTIQFDFSFDLKKQK